uniref:[histone H3]-lysine(4) N-trimethyltransferase n=1 Tax=Phallusia mammillata TaxID=59560 RepID=A0A6F9DRC2_9ASCI|nr:histone-lysine N-methyltransferase SETD1B-A-like [Phallusia mammillata]
MAQRPPHGLQGPPIPRGNFKLIVDPQLKKGQQKLVRFNGDSYSTENHGQGPVVVRDPRPRSSRLWAKRERVDLPVPRYKIDDNYIGAIPPREITFSKLNDNVTKQFIEQLCGKFGKLERVRVYYHPKTNKHMGLAKVVFASIKSASQCIENLHQTSIMGNVISAVIDSKGDVLKRLHHKILKGELIAETMPDVIRHTQEKPIPRPESRTIRRKSSHDDPRRRQSTDSLPDHPSSSLSHSLSTSSGPKTPPMMMHNDGPQTPPADIPHPREQPAHLQDPGLVEEQKFHPYNHQPPRKVAQPPQKHPHHPTPALRIPPQHFPPRDQKNAQSLESGYGSHPNSATLPTEQASPGLGGDSGSDFPGSSLFESSRKSFGSSEHLQREISVEEPRKKHKKKHKKKKKREESHHRSSDQDSDADVSQKPSWANDLENRIDLLLSEQNEKFNLKETRHRDRSKPERRGSETSQKSSSNEHYPSNDRHRKHGRLKKSSSDDREDGECSGEEQGSAASVDETIVNEVPSKRVSQVDSDSDHGRVSPRLRSDVREELNRARSPSPRPHFPPSPPPMMEPHRHIIEPPGGIHGGRRSPEFHRPPHDAYRFPNYHRPGSPGRRSPGFIEHHRGFHPPGFEPRFDHRRRSPSFDHRPRGRSPGFDHRPHRHHSPPFRGRPPSPGFSRRHPMPPDHPDFHRHGYNHPRRSISPPQRRFGSPGIHRSFDDNPHRDRFMPHHSPPGVHRRGPSPPHMDPLRRDRRSPSFHRGGFRHPSPEQRRLREHRELPPEFLERQKLRRSISPDSSRGAPGHSRMDVDSPHHHHHYLDANGRIRQRSRSSSPSILQRTPPRIRSPVPVRQDQRPYSPGDLRIGDSLPGGPDLIPSSAVESDVACEVIKPGKRGQRESSDQDAPQISLDERLREITGEPPPEPEPPSPTNDDSEKSPSGSLDMEISSGSGGPPSPSQAPSMNHPYSGAGFRPPFQGVSHPQHQSQWGFGREMWNGYDPRMPVPGQPQMWGGVRPDHPQFHPRPGMSNGFPPHVGFPHTDAHRGEHPFDPNMLPPPPPGWNRPWVQIGQPQHPAQMGSMPPQNFSLNDGTDGNKFIDNCVLNRISGELKEIIKKDLNRKMIETIAFRVYESWWDSQNAPKNPKPVVTSKPTAAATTTEVTKTEADKENIDKTNTTKPAGKPPTLLNTFDPLNWAKGSLEMDGFRIGLGLRSAISKMPSFRVKKRTPSPQPVPSKKMKMAEINRNKMAENKRHSRKGSQVGKKRRVYLDSGGEDEDASDVDSSDEEDRNKMGRVRLDVDDVFSSSESSSSEEDESDEDDDDDVEDSEDDKETEKEEDSDKEEFITPKKLMKQERIDEDEEISQTSKRSSTKEEDQFGPPKKRARADLEIKLESSDTESVAKAASSLSEMKSASPLISPTTPAGASLTPQDLKHVHPKKRYRLLSKEETSNLDLIAEVSGLHQSSDEISTMNDKEKAALEILTDMKTTPERFRSSTTSSDSSEQPLHPATPGRQLSGSVFSPPQTPNVPRRTSVTTDNLHPLDSHPPVTPGSRKTALPSVEDARKSGSEELEAVEALLSIKQSQPPLPPLSPSPVKSKSKEERKVQKPQPFVPPKRVVSMETCARVLEIAEEHSYFNTLPGNNREHYDATLDRMTQQVYNEHSYSYSPLRYASYFEQDFETETATFSEMSAAEISAASAAERVKLRRESKDTKKSRVKSRIPAALLDERKVRPTVKFKRRSELEEMSILYLMWGLGLDLEDMKLLRAEYEEMLKLGTIPWVNETHWVAHPITGIPDADGDARSQERKSRSRRAKKQENVTTKNHKTGCARSEGYYKLTDKSKLIQRRLMYRQADNAIKPGSRKGLEPHSTPATNLATEKSREARHMMRRIASEFGSDVSDLLKYNQLMFRKKSVKFARSSIHGWGLFAQETIGADEMVIEYVGELVRSSVADRREVVYTKRGIGSSYLFRIDSDHIIDATKCGNYARFMNHSCNPSCYAKVITVDGAKKIVIYSKDVIKPQDEITYDYKFPLEDIKIPCFCGAPTCRGTLN